MLMKKWCESTLLRRFAQRGPRAVSEVSTQIWAFLKNSAFEESSSVSTTLYAKHSSIYLLSSSQKYAHFLLRLQFRAPDWALFEKKMSKKFMSIKNCVCVSFEDKNMNFERFLMQSNVSAEQKTEFFNAALILQIFLVFFTTSFKNAFQEEFCGF